MLVETCMFLFVFTCSCSCSSLWPWSCLWLGSQVYAHVPVLVLVHVNVHCLSLLAHPVWFSKTKWSFRMNMVLCIRPIHLLFLPKVTTVRGVIFMHFAHARVCFVYALSMYIFRPKVTSTRVEKDSSVSNIQEAYLIYELCCNLKVCFFFFEWPFPSKTLYSICLSIITFYPSPN